MLTPEQAHDAIDQLLSTGKPAPALEGHYKDFTVGSSQKYAHEILNSISSLHALRTEFIAGDFGTGKSHTLRLLKELIKNAAQDTGDFPTIATADLSLAEQIEDASELQGKIFETLTIYDDNRTLTSSDALKFIYQRIRQKHVRSWIERLNAQAKVRNLITGAVQLAVEIAYPIGSMPYLLAKAAYDEWLQNTTVERGTRQEIEELREHHEAVQRGFIESFIAHGEGRSNYLASYNKMLMKASRNWEYFDILMRIFRLAGYEKFVVFIDEAEYFTAGIERDQQDNRILRVVFERRAEIGNMLLQQFHDLYNKISDAGTGYPAILQVITLPENSTETINQLNPGLGDVWFRYYNVHQLGIVDQEGMKQLIRNIDSIMRKASPSAPLEPHEIANIQQRVYSTLEKRQINNPDSLSLAKMRVIIPLIIDEIKILNNSRSR